MHFLYYYSSYVANPSRNVKFERIDIVRVAPKSPRSGVCCYIRSTPTVSFKRSLRNHGDDGSKNVSEKWIYVFSYSGITFVLLRRSYRFVPFSLPSSWWTFAQASYNLVYFPAVCSDHHIFAIWLVHRTYYVSSDWSKTKRPLTIVDHVVPGCFSLHVNSPLVENPHNVS